MWLLIANVPINGMPQLVYLGQILEKGGGFLSESSLRGWYLVMQDYPLKLHILFCYFKCLWKIRCKFHRWYAYLHVTYCADVGYL